MTINKTQDRALYIAEINFPHSTELFKSVI